MADYDKFRDDVLWSSVIPLMTSKVDCIFIYTQLATYTGLSSWPWSLWTKKNNGFSRHSGWAVVTMISHLTVGSFLQLQEVDCYLTNLQPHKKGLYIDCLLLWSLLISHSLAATNSSGHLPNSLTPGPLPLWLPAFHCLYG